MRNKALIAITLAGSVALSGCATPQGPNEEGGIIIGSIIGGVLGAQVGRGSGRTAAIIIGSLAGAAIGGNVGRYMDDTDRMKTAHALETVRTGVPTSWRNPDTGYEYEVTSTRTIEEGPGPCREYTVEAMIGGKKETTYGTACRQADGSWRVQN